MRRIEAGSYYSYLPEGCKLCRKGAKLVLFVTGICKESCFYCPISYEKRGKDLVFANERPVEKIDDFLTELELMDAEGIAITGGEPLLRLDRVLEYGEIAKKMGLHVHIYTSVPAKEEALKKLSEVVDEIRFHPPELRDPEKYKNPIKFAKKIGIDAGFEIPAIKYEPSIVEIANELDAFLNLNQLEVSESNWKNIIERGYEVEDYYVNLPEVVKKYENVNKFHYCSAKFKDIAQFRRRLIRMALNHPEFYKVTEEGTIICCQIEGDLEKAEKILKEKGIDYIKFDECIETSVDIIDEIGEYLKSEGFRLSIVERYPTSNRTILEVMQV